MRAGEADDGVTQQTVLFSARLLGHAGQMVRSRIGRVLGATASVYDGGVVSDRPTLGFNYSSMNFYCDDLTEAEVETLTGCAASDKKEFSVW